MSKVPAPLIEFFSYMEEVRDIASIALHEPSVKKKNRIGNQPLGKRLQDCLDMTEIKRDKLDFSNCANCKHNFLLPVGPDEMEINAHNERVKNTYHQAMHAYNNRSRSRKGERKPKMGRSISRKLACLCTRMNYVGRMDGVGCLKCEWACFEFKKAKRKSCLLF